MIYQFISLERRSTRIGRDIVAHPAHANSHDDLANSAAGALVLAGSEHLTPSLWRNADLLNNNRPIVWPVRSQIVYATAAVDDRGVYVAYWSKGADFFEAGTGAVLLIDYHQSPLHPSLFRDVSYRLEQLTSELVPHPSGAIIPCATNRGVLVTQELQPHAEQFVLNFADGTALLQQRDALLLACGSWIAGGCVKISDLADIKSRTLPLPLSEIHSQAPESAACSAVLLGLGCSLPPELQPVEWRDAV